MPAFFDRLKVILNVPVLSVLCVLWSLYYDCVLNGYPCDSIMNFRSVRRFWVW